MSYYRKRPVIVQAYRFDVSDKKYTWPEWISQAVDRGHIQCIADADPPYLVLQMPLVDARIDIGDWIVNDGKGVLSPVSNDEFVREFEGILELLCRRCGHSLWSKPPICTKCGAAYPMTDENTPAPGRFNVGDLVCVKAGMGAMSLKRGAIEHKGGAYQDYYGVRFPDEWMSMGFSEYELDRVFLGF